MLCAVYSLGCGIGYGYLHRIPSDLLEEKRKQRAALSVPHSMQPPQPAAPVQPTSSAAAGTSTTTSADGFSEVSGTSWDAPISALYNVLYGCAGSLVNSCCISVHR